MWDIVSLGTGKQGLNFPHFKIQMHKNRMLGFELVFFFFCNGTRYKSSLN
jgi:hypothetical protein